MNTKLTPHQAGILRRVARALRSPQTRVAAVRKLTVPAPSGVRTIAYVGSAGALEHLTEKGYLAVETMHNGIGGGGPVEQRYYSLTDKGQAWWLRQQAREVKAS